MIYFLSPPKFAVLLFCAQMWKPISEDERPTWMSLLARTWEKYQWNMNAFCGITKGSLFRSVFFFKLSFNHLLTRGNHICRTHMRQIWMNVHSYSLHTPLQSSTPLPMTAFWSLRDRREARQGCATYHSVIPEAWGHITATGSLTLCVCVRACVCSDQAACSSCRALGHADSRLWPFAASVTERVKERER